MTVVTTATTTTLSVWHLLGIFQYLSTDCQRLLHLRRLSATRKGLICAIARACACACFLLPFVTIFGFHLPGFVFSLQLSFTTLQLSRLRRLWCLKCSDEDWRWPGCARLAGRSLLRVWHCYSDKPKWSRSCNQSVMKKGAATGRDFFIDVTERLLVRIVPSGCHRSSIDMDGDVRKLSWIFQELWMNSLLF